MTATVDDGAAAPTPGAAAAPARLRDDRDFRRYWSAQTVSLFGDHGLLAGR